MINSPIINILATFITTLTIFISVTSADADQQLFTFSRTDSSSFKSQSFPYLGKWIYTTSSGSILNYVQYDPAQTNKQKIITKSPLSTGNNYIRATSPTFDCIVTHVSGQSIDTIQINSASSTATIINNWNTIVNSGDISTNQIDLISSTTNAFLAGSNCWAFKVKNLVYFKNTQGTSFTRSTAASSFTSPIFTPQLKFVYSSGEVYKFTTTDYTQILTVSGLKTTVAIFPSSDQNKILILSYQAIGTGNSFITIIKLFASTGSTWNEIVLDSSISSITTYEYQVGLYYSPNLQTIGVIYSGNISNTKRIVSTFGKVNYSANTFSLYTTINNWNNGFILPSYVYVYDNYMYINTLISQYVYKINKSNLTIQQVFSRALTQYDYAIFRGLKIVEENNQVSVIYQTQPITSTIKLSRLKIVSTTTTNQTNTSNQTNNNSNQNTSNQAISNQDGSFSQNNQIFLCTTGCIVCSSQTICTTCMQGFIKDSNSICNKCSSLCSTCLSANSTQCTSCFNGFYLSLNTCLKCHDSCLTCTGQGNMACQTCKSGLYRQSNGSCINCINNCIRCSPLSINDPLCTQCEIGYAYDSNSKKCVKCISGCTNCNSLRVYECQSCHIGFVTFYNSDTLKTQCVKCQNNCQTCFSNGTCSLCRDNFRLVNNKCVDQCSFPCNNCSENDPAKCISCFGGYILNGQTCIPDLSCNAGSNCTYCVIGFNLISGVCQKCNGGNNCEACENNNINKCSSCVRGYYIDISSVCALCSIGCTVCENEYFCKVCQSGYVLQSSSGSQKCIKCNVECQTCNDFPYRCETCAFGYIKRGWNCISQRYIQISVQLNGIFSSFTTAQYILIRQQLSRILNKSQDNINIDVLKSSSIIVGGTITVANKQQQSTLMNQLTTALGGSSFGGFTIEQSSVSGSNFIQNNGDDQSQKNKRTTAIIVGIIVPVVVITILIVLFVLYKKGMICRTRQQMKVVDGTMDDMQ